MTIGRGRVSDSAWSAQSACSRISARSLRIRTVARRTVQTLIGSKEALSTSTRPDEVPRCSVRRPGSARTGTGTVSPASRGRISARTATVRASVAGAWPVLGSWIRAEHPDRFHPLAQRRQRLVDRGPADGALQVGEEHVVPQPHAAGPRLDLGQVDPPVGELAQDRDEGAGRLVVKPPEDDRALGPRPGVDLLGGGGKPDEAGLVVR